MDVYVCMCMCMDVYVFLRYFCIILMSSDIPIVGCAWSRRRRLAVVEVEEGRLRRKRRMEARARREPDMFVFGGVCFVICIFMSIAGRREKKKLCVSMWLAEMYVCVLVVNDETKPCVISAASNNCSFLPCKKERRREREKKKSTFICVSINSIEKEEHTTKKKDHLHMERSNLECAYCATIRKGRRSLPPRNSNSRAFLVCCFLSSVERASSSSHFFAS